MSLSKSSKYPNGIQKVYYHLRCKNHNCSGFWLNYNTEKIEMKLKRIFINNNIKVMTNIYNLFRQMRFNKNAEQILYNINESKKFLSKF